MPANALLIALADARRRRDQADQQIRLLLAYAREISVPRYRLADLAEAAGMSISGVRTAYTRADVRGVTQMPAPPDSLAFQEYWLTWGLIENRLGLAGSG